MLNDLTQEQLKALFLYDPETGIFIRRKASFQKPSGRVNSWGYVQIFVSGKRYMAHRLAWLYVTGKWPDNQIDHKNRIKTDNRFENLREATGGENCQNLPMHADNVTGLKGVSFNKRDNKFQAKIMKDGIELALGYFNTAEAAHEAYKRAKAELHTFNPSI